MAQHVHIAIIGSGPGGYIAALRAAHMGAKVAVAERRQLGGTCLNWGCIPSKALLASAETLHRVRHAGALGIGVKGEVTFDWPAIQARKDKVIQTLRNGIKSLFKARGVAVLAGRAVLDGPGRIVVQAEGRPAEVCTADKIILAVGSQPARLPGWPADPKVVCTSDESLHWADLPKRLLIVGGGVIGCEFACMMEPLGVQVTVVEMLPSLLPEMDTDLGEAMRKILTGRGVKCFTGTKVEHLEIAGGDVLARLGNGQEVRADRVLVAIGRRPETENIGLETVGLTTDRGFLRVDDHMETAHKGIYCIGDANGRCLLAHAASAHGVCAVENALGHVRAFDLPIPSTAYTFPEIASVGMTEKAARAGKIPIAIGAFPIGHLGKAMAVGQIEGFVKVICSRPEGRLLGVHMLGHNVTECIAAAGALLHQRVAVRDVADLVVAHPTIAEAFKEAMEDSLGQAPHLPPRKVLRIAAGKAVQ